MKRTSNPSCSSHALLANSDPGAIQGGEPPEAARRFLASVFAKREKVLGTLTLGTGVVLLLPRRAGRSEASADWGRPPPTPSLSWRSQLRMPEAMGTNNLPREYDRSISRRTSVIVVALTKNARRVEPTCNNTRPACSRGIAYALWRHPLDGTHHTVSSFCFSSCSSQLLPVE